VATPTEAHRALREGFDHVKVFPAAALGGPDFLRQLLAPFPQLQLFPSGGISLETVRDYLVVPGVFAVSGSWMVSNDRTLPRDTGKIRALALETLERIRKA
jgi:2-dehydro-3-deoxyphosphogluconate aldolase / (4S)-4-hydroxy-2-oxoglutarate aldolase